MVDAGAGAASANGGYSAFFIRTYLEPTVEMLSLLQSSRLVQYTSLCSSSPVAA
jgi:hypothetical protein